MTKNSASVLVVALLALFVPACGSDTDSPRAEAVSTGGRSESLSPETVVRIEKFCGDCHSMPIPATFPKSRWPDEVRRGFEFYVESKRTDLAEPLRNEVIRYYQSAAPEEVVVPRADAQSETPASVVFRPQAAQVKVPAESSALPAIAQLQVQPGQSALLFSDMSGGGFWRWPFDSASSEPKLLYPGKNLCKASRCDWNKDGVEDYLLAEMGAFPVADHQLGSITLLLGKADGSFQSIELASGLSRVVEAKPFDYDEDGDTDVLVADFGWHKTGALRLLRNTGGSMDQPQMNAEILENKHGALGVEIADIDQDGHSDFVVCYGQEYESVELHLRRGPGEYEHQVIDRLKDPSYNASSFHLADVDGDGRLDIVHTCGDTMDSMLAKPYHGVRWIQNLGEKGWKPHELGLLVGALNATSADFDGDGDLDIAGVGLFPDASRSPGAYNSVCWWEQREDLKFVQHTVERDTCNHAACTAQDVNGDGRVDLIVGLWQSADSSAVKVFLNTASK